MSFLLFSRPRIEWHGERGRERGNVTLLSSDWGFLMGGDLGSLLGGRETRRG